MALLSGSCGTLAGKVTFAVLCTLLLRRRHTTRGQRARDIKVCVLCLVLYPLKRPQLPLALAIAYTVWTYVPGSHNARDLPDHATFMRNLLFVTQSEPPTHCIVCCNRAHRLAALPCRHRCCDRCLRLISEDFHAACPNCRRRLFSTDDGRVHHRVEPLAAKANVILTAITVVLQILNCFHELRRAQLAAAIDSFGCALTLSCPLLAVGFLVRLYGEDWWRIALGTVGDSTSLSESLACVVFALYGALLCGTLWETREAFI